MSSVQARIGKVIAWIFVGFVLIMAGTITVVLNVDWNRSRPWINAKVSETIGRSFVIEGPISVTWSRSSSEQGWRMYVPWPQFSVENIRVANPNWAKKPYLATLDKVYFNVAMLPLLYREVVISNLTLTHPAIDLERLTDGRVNWVFDMPPSSSSWRVNVHEITFATGNVDFSDQIKKINLSTTVTPIGQSVNITPMDDKHTVEPYVFALNLKGTFNKASIAGAGKMGGVMSLNDPKKRFPVQADLRIGDNHFVFNGALNDPAHLAAFDVQLHLAANSMAHLYELTGITLPETPPFKTAGHLIGSFEKNNKHFKYENFSGTVGGSDLSGTLDYRSQFPRPKLTGKVKSKKLIFSDLAPLIGADSNAKKALRGAPLQKANKAMPQESFRPERWKVMDADVEFTGEQIIHNPALPVSDIYTHLVMKDGVINLNPLKFGVAGGTLTGNMHLDGSQAPLKEHFLISARHLKLKQLFPTFELMKTSFGQLSGDADLSAVGDSPAMWAATSNGEIKLLVKEGAISSTLLEEAGLNVLNIVAAKLFGDKTVKINCAAADFVIKKGLLDSRLFALDTEDAFIHVNGTVNLATERMNLDVYPRTKGFRIFSLRSPLYVKGTFKKPQVGVAMQPLLVRGGSAIGLGLINPFAALIALVAPSNDDALPCTGLMAEARRGLGAVHGKSRKVEQ